MSWYDPRTWSVNDNPITDLNDATFRKLPSPWDILVNDGRATNLPGWTPTLPTDPGTLYDYPYIPGTSSPSPTSPTAPYSSQTGAPYLPPEMVQLGERAFDPVAQEFGEVISPYTDKVLDPVFTTVDRGLDAAGDSIKEGVDSIVDFVASPTNQTITNVPWDKQQPYLLEGFKNAQNGLNSALNSGYPALSQVTNQGLGSLQSVAGNNPYLNPAQNTLINQSGYTNPYASQYSSYMGVNSPTQGMYGNVINRAGNNPYNELALDAISRPNYGTGYLDSLNLRDNETAGYLRNFAQGNYMGANPYLDSIADRASQKASEAFQRNLGDIRKAYAGGRGGTNAYATAINRASDQANDSLNAALTNLYGNAYETGMDRMLSGTNALGTVNAGGMGRDLQRGGLFSDNYNTGVRNVLDTAGLTSSNFNTGTGQMLSGLGAVDSNFWKGNDLGMTALNNQVGTADRGAGIRLDAINSMPTIRNMQYQDPLMMMQGGGVIDKYNMGKTMFPLDVTGQYMNVVNGNYGGTQTQPGPSNLQNMMGTGLDLAMMGKLFGVWGK